MSIRISGILTLPMTPKAGWLPRYNLFPYVSTYENWDTPLDAESAPNWPDFCQQFAENFQLGLLRALTVMGILPSYWNDVFVAVQSGMWPFENLAKGYFQNTLGDPYYYFLGRLNTDTTVISTLPAPCPEWLFPFRYSQRQYLGDLAYVWDNIQNWYYTPWETTRIGQDSPEVARLKKIGREAREEIDLLAGYTSPHFWNQRNVNDPPF